VTAVAARGAVVIPSATKTVDGDTVATDGLLLASVMNTPPDGAAVPKATGKLTVSPGATVMFVGTRIPPAGADCVTVTLAVAPAIFGALAVTETDPGATPVTGTDALAVPAANVTVAGTVATVASLELTFAVRAAEAGAERFNVRFCVLFTLTVRLLGQKLIVVPGVPPDPT